MVLYLYLSIRKEKNQLFAIIDIETCGGSFALRKGRIIEICILIHDGLTVIDKLSTLVNPECYISPLYTRISGITNDMVANAPKFHEIASDILRITEGQIFVAHNVNFDYGFVKEEFASLGYKYQRDTLCTVRLSRKLIPGQPSYSLGKLCSNLGIPLENRHRAEGDAQATALLFNLLLQIKGTHPQYKSAGIDQLMVRKVDNIKAYILKQLPESCGVYYFKNQEQEIIYIGKSTNMYNRAISHFNASTKKARQMQADLHSVDYVGTGSEILALILEAQEIKKNQPLYNRLTKTEHFSHAIDWTISTAGIYTFRICEAIESASPLQLFPSYIKAKMFLENLIETKQLCLSYCGIQTEGEVCFNQQIRKCLGICAGQESILEYNKRAKDVVRKYSYQLPNFFFTDKGREPDEMSFVLVLNNKYRGYGYLDRDISISTIEELENHLEIGSYYADLDHLVKSWIVRKKPRLIAC